MWKSLPYKGFVYFSLVTNISLGVLILALKGLLPPVVPLFYGLPAGVEQLTPSLGLILAPTTGLVITALNIFFSSLTSDEYLKKTLIIAGTFVSLLIAIATVKIVLLVGFF